MDASMSTFDFTTVDTPKEMFVSLMSMVVEMEQKTPNEDAIRNLWDTKIKGSPQEDYLQGKFRENCVCLAYEILQDLYVSSGRDGVYFVDDSGRVQTHRGFMDIVPYTEKDGEILSEHEYLTINGQIIPFRRVIPTEYPDNDDVVAYPILLADSTGKLWLPRITGKEAMETGAYTMNATTCWVDLCVFNDFIRDLEMVTTYHHIQRYGSLRMSCVLRLMEMET